MRDVDLQQYHYILHVYDGGTAPSGSIYHANTQW